MTELPKGWCRAKLDELFEMTGGGTPSTDEPTYWGKGFPWITSADIDSSSNYTVRKEVTPRGVEKSATNVVGPNTVLVVSRVGLGKVALSKEHLCYSQDVQGLPVSADCFDPRFVKVQLSFLMEALKYEGRGTTIKGLTKTQLKNTFFSFPPLNEQRRIVEKIEAMFEEIDAGTQSLRTAQAKLGLYRQSLLKSAFEGRLTADWRAQNPDKLEDPETLLSRIQSERDTRYKAALDDWQKALAKWREDGEQGKKPAKPKPLAEFAFQEHKPEQPWPTVKVQTLLGAPLINGRSVKDKAGGFPVLRLTSLKNGQILLSESKEGDWSEADAQPFLVKRDDIFLARGNGSKKLVGIAGRVMQTPMPVAFPDTMIRVRLDSSTVRPDFFLLAWNSWTVRSQIESAARTTAGIYKINQDHVSGFALPLPSIAEQSEIVRILDAKLEAADALEAEITAALTRADALRQSILKKAFSGRLVPQDPNDEPASALLDRIKANRAAAPKAKRTRKTSA